MGVYDKERDSLTTKYTSMPPELVKIVEEGLGYPFIGYRFPRNNLSSGSLLHPTVLSNPVAEIQLLFARLSIDEVMKLLQEIGVGPEMEPLRLPLTFEENLLGVLWIWGQGLTKADLPIMSIFAKQIGVSLERARLFQEVQSLALTDPLTGLQNRRSLFELGRVEFARAKRMKRPFCCMMLDLDHFKRINDEYGHLIGDQVLQEFAKRCACSVREVDLVGRYGGEELIILLPETDRKTSIQVAERLRTTVAATPIQVFDKKIFVTASIGVATQDENTIDLETLIARADQAMYIAKHKGRNCVAISK
jgi:diguanylate cyclase (GGDEF)-like protein